MNKIDLPRLFKQIGIIFQKRAPGILTGVGIAGMVTTTILAVKATPKALYLIEEAKEERDMKQRETLPVKTVIQVAWKPYIPSMITGGLSVACLIGASAVNVRRKAAIFTAYTLSETALREYRDKVVNTIGEEKEQEIRDEISRDKIKSIPETSALLYSCNDGDTLCFDTISGRVFVSNIDKIKRVVAELNQRLIVENYISLNDFYYELDKERLSHARFGDDLGWNIDDGMIEVAYSSMLLNDRTPCLTIDYDYAPRFDFRTLY